MGRRVLRAGLLLATSVIACESAGRAAETIVYSYDSLGRLVRVERSRTASPDTSAAYSYDSADNRTNVTVSVTAAPPSAPLQAPANLPLDPFAVDSGSQPQCTTAADGVCAPTEPPPGDPPPAPPSDEAPE